MSWQDRPTGYQLHRIACLASILGMREYIEERPETRGDARRIQYLLLLALKDKNRQRAKKGCKT